MAEAYKRLSKELIGKYIIWNKKKFSNDYNDCDKQNDYNDHYTLNNWNINWNTDNISSRIVTSSTFSNTKYILFLFSFWFNIFWNNNVLDYEDQYDDPYDETTTTISKYPKKFQSKTIAEPKITKARKSGRVKDLIFT